MNFERSVASFQNHSHPFCVQRTNKQSSSPRSPVRVAATSKVPRASSTTIYIHCTTRKILIEEESCRIVTIRKPGGSVDRAAPRRDTEWLVRARVDMNNYHREIYKWPRISSNVSLKIADPCMRVRALPTNPRRSYVPSKDATLPLPTENLVRWSHSASAMDDKLISIGLN